MRRLIWWGTFAMLVTVISIGCGKESTSTHKETVTGPGGTTTTTDTHKVESSGKNPPANSAGEAAK